MYSEYRVSTTPGVSMNRERWSVCRKRNGGGTEFRIVDGVQSAVRAGAKSRLPMVAETLYNGDGSGSQLAILLDPRWPCRIQGAS